MARYNAGELVSQARASLAEPAGHLRVQRFRSRLCQGQVQVFRFASSTSAILMSPMVTLSTPALLKANFRDACRSSRKVKEPSPTSLILMTPVSWVFLLHLLDHFADVAGAGVVVFAIP